MKKCIFKIDCIIYRSVEKTYGFVKAYSEETAKILFIQEVSTLYGRLEITQVVEVSEEEFEKAMKGE